jgi:hypothetical protein
MSGKLFNLLPFLGFGESDPSPSFSSSSSISLITLGILFPKTLDFFYLSL